MNILLMCDSFKDSMDSVSINRQIATAWESRNKADSCDCCAIADGGEGTTEVLVSNLRGHLQQIKSFDPLMRPVFGTIGWVGKKAIIEVASVSGLQLLSATERNPWLTTSFGTGYLIRSAVELGATEVVLALGGSATNDAGIGLLQGLGGRFYDQYHNEVPPGAKYLTRIEHYDLSLVYQTIKNCRITVASDVVNPLLGQRGATEVFSRQKGASEPIVKALEQSLAHIVSLFLKKSNIRLNDYRGGGAAGGIGAIAQGVLKGSMIPGIELVLSACDAETRVQKADLIITGEGKLDSQSLSGKAPYGILKMAQKYDKKVIVICGVCELSRDEYIQHGFANVYELSALAPTVADSMYNVARWINACVEIISEDVRAFR